MRENTRRVRKRTSNMRDVLLPDSSAAPQYIYGTFQERKCFSFTKRNLIRSRKGVLIIFSEKLDSKIHLLKINNEVILELLVPLLAILLCPFALLLQYIAP